LIYFAPLWDAHPAFGYFVGCVVGFLNLSKIRSRNILLAVALSFEREMI
jgi:hypothetical protein